MPLLLPCWAVPLWLLHPQAVLLLFLLFHLSLLPSSLQRLVPCFPPLGPLHSPWEVMEMHREG